MGSRPLLIAAAGAFPVWSPDGSRIVFKTNDGSKIQRVDRDSPLAEIPGVQSDDSVSDWSRDGRRLLITGTRTAVSRSTDIMLYDFEARSLRALVATSANELQGRFSPDGRRVAYTSDASGSEEVYVRDFVDAAAVSPAIGRGSHPAWRRDGRELFYLGPNDEMMAVEITPGMSQPAGTPKQLFRIPLNDITRSFASPFDVAPDGERFLLNVPETPSPLFYVRGLEQWLAGK
jgi:dipeptidyl aminopeptidase/acylaminoacyl peptidase